MAQVKLDEYDRYCLFDERIEGLDLSGAVVPELDIGQSVLVGCNFRGIIIDKVYFGSGRIQTTYTNCDFTGSTIRSGSAGEARFVNCLFRDVMISNFLALNGEFIDCFFSGRLDGVVFDGRHRPPSDVVVDKRTRNEFRGNDFSEVEWRNVAFRGGIDLSLQKLPKRDCIVIENLAEALKIARERIFFTWEPSWQREDVLGRITVLTYDVDSGQQAAVVRIDDICEDGEAARRAAAVLVEAGQTAAGEDTP
jgi:hypothetical protein